MAGDGKKLQPIIVKRIKKGGHAAHGGAWKIAYADFVTAMMAFFLLMWLLGSTSAGDLKGISDYFSSPVKVSLMGGDGTGNSDSVLPGGGRDLSRSAGQVHGGDAERAAKLMGAQMARAELARKDAARIDALHAKIRDMVTNNPTLADFGAQIRIDRTADGLQIQIVDDQNRAMFDVGSAVVKPYMRDILRAIGGALSDVENRLALSGHTDATPYGSGDRGYSNWELSSDRANASRRELVAGGLPDDKLVRVEGLSSSRLLEPQAPTAPINRRISILVLTKEAERRMMPVPPGEEPDPLANAEETAPLEGVGPAPAVTPVMESVPVTTGTVALPPIPLQKPADLTKSHAEAGG